MLTVLVIWIQAKYKQEDWQLRYIATFFIDMVIVESVFKSLGG